MTETQPRTRDSERTRQSLLKAAEELFAERGAAGASTDDIARRSGVNKAMINYHFGGKDQLYAAIVNENVAGALDRLEALTSSPLRADAKLREFISIFAHVHMEKGALSTMILREVLSGGRLIDEVFREKILRVFGVLGEILAQGAREGSLRPVSPVEAHLSMMGALLFFFATRPFRERMEAEGKLPLARVTPEAYVEYLQALMTRGLAPSVTRLAAAPAARRKARPRAKPAAPRRSASKPEARAKTKSTPESTSRRRTSR